MFKEALELGSSGFEVFPTGGDKRDGKWAQNLLASSGVVELKAFLLICSHFTPRKHSDGQKAGGRDRETI